MVWTRPLPKVVSPTIRPRSWSWMRSGHDLRGARAVARGQDHEGHLRVGALGLGDVVGLVAAGAAAGEDHHLALLQEQVRDREGLVEQAAGVVADVEDHRGGPALHELLHRLLELALAVGSLAGPAGGGLVEVLQAHVAHALAGHEGVGHGVQGDGVADDRELEGLVVALAHDGDAHGRALGAAQALHRVVDAHAPGVRRPRSC